MAQLIVILDSPIVNIALPSAQKALHITNTGRQWMVTAYTLSFAGLLLLGGRIADCVGRREIFAIGLLDFAGTVTLGGLTVVAPMLFGARALQGACGMLLAPAALSLISVTLTEMRERFAAVLLVAFVVIEMRSTNPLLPMRILLGRNRGGSYLSALMVGSGLLGMFLLLTYYFQGVPGYSALRANVDGVSGEVALV